MPRRPDAVIKPNNVLREARFRMPSPFRSGQRMSRPELADAVNAALDRLYPGRDLAAQYVDFRWVGKLERGEHRWSSRERRTALRHVLGAATDSQLDLYSPRRTDTATYDQSADQVHRDHAGATEDVATDRAERLSNPLTAKLVNAMLTPATDNPVEHVSADVLTGLASRAWLLRQGSRYEELARLLPGLISQAEAAIDVLDDVDERRAVHAAVHAYNAASSLLRRTGDTQLALIAADRATRAAKAADDPILIASAMYRLANVLLADNRPDDAKAIALHAADLTSPSRTNARHGIALWGGLLLTAAVAAARARVESEAWELLGEARAGSRLVGTDHADLYAIFGPTNVAMHGVQVAVELRNGWDAVRRSHAVDPDRLPASLLERRGQFLIDVAHGNVLEKNDAEAVALLNRALQIAPEEVQLNRDVRQLTETMLSRERTGAAPELRQLAAAVGVTT